MRAIGRVLYALALLPSLAAAATLDVGGEWSLVLDPGDRGIEQRWFSEKLAASQAIALPGTTDLAGIGAAETDPDPGYLSRAHRYVGPAWYERVVEVPPGWREQQVELFLERVMWQSDVWIDGAHAGTGDSLGTPHRFRLGPLEPGRHRLTIRVDNRMIHPIGDRGHAYTEHTQSVWNGIVGRMELRSRPAASLGLVRVFPDADAGSIRVAAEIINEAVVPADASLAIDVLAPDGRVVAGQITAVDAAARSSFVVESVIALDGAVRRWDEFAPALYAVKLRLEVDAGRDERSLRFGFRTLGRDGTRLLVNGRPTFLRGNLDNAAYPLTGHPPVDVSTWRRILGVYRDHGLNHVRFHSWTPPEAAFAAADELGMYLQVEVLWIDGWMTGAEPGTDAYTAGRPLGVGLGDRSVDDYVQAEIRRVLDAYGNHPSFVLFVIGNELGSSDFDVLGEWIREHKRRDPRRLYAASTARAITLHDDVAVTHKPPGGAMIVNQRARAGTDWDYDANFGDVSIPVIAHEAGQVPVYPDWSEIDKYAGPLLPDNLQRFRAMARRNGIEQQGRALQSASGGSNRIIYKHEMEAQLRSSRSSGLQWLGMQDFPGQGEALVGWLDSFYDSKGFVTPQQFRQYSNTTVPLARFARYVWTNSETFTANIEAAHWGAAAIEARVRWRLADAGGRPLAEGRFAPRHVEPGERAAFGTIRFDLGGIREARQMRLRVWLEDTAFMNHWDLWVYPDEPPAPVPANVVVTADPERALDALQAGGRVLLLAHNAGDDRLAAWLPLFWSARFFPGQNRETLGALVDAGHPALAAFPTGDFLDWQWRDICTGASGFVLDDQDAAYRPIVQPVSDFHFNHKLGALFEFRSVAGGRLLVSGYDIDSGLGNRPAARQLRKSLFAYVAGPDFDPGTGIDAARFRDYFVKPGRVVASPEEPGFESAALYVDAGREQSGLYTAGWTASLDRAVVQDGIAYRVQADGVWKTGDVSAWISRAPIRVTVDGVSPALYDLYVQFLDWGSTGRTGSLRFEGRQADLGRHAGEPAWVRLDVLREDALDGRLVFEATPAAGDDLIITKFALVPK